VNDILVAWVLVLASTTVGGQTGQQAPPVSPPPVASPPSAPLSFPSATRVAYFDPDRVFGTTNEGKRLGGILQAFRQKKFTELAERNKQLETLRAKRQAAGLLSSASLDLLDKDISRLGVEIERAAQDAEAEYNDRLSQVQADFRRLLQPVVEKTLKEHGIHVLLTPAAGVSWVDPAVDLTTEIAARFDAATPSAVPKAG